MSGPFGLPLPLLTDTYKACHFALYPEMREATAYAEFRSAYDKDENDQRIVFYGIRYVLEQYISRQWTQRDVDLAEAFFATYNAEFKAYPFPRALFNKFVEENNGYFPVRIDSMAEGSVVYPHTPVLQITARDEYAPLITYLETVLLMTWYPSTVATLSFRSRSAIEESYAHTVDDDAMWTLDSRMHDFGFRGCTCVEQSILGGSAHLLAFDGTDTMSAAYYVQFMLNGGRPVATSIPATEHSVMTAHRSELEAILRTIEEYGDGVYACVMDSYDYARVLSDILPVVAEKKLEKGGFLVIRPDSGDQVGVVLQGLYAADKVFGSTVNGKGFKVINGASVIQGDGVTPDSLRRILDAVRNAGFSTQCVGFGMGGGLLQRVDRDITSMAVKISSVVYADGETRDIMKFPKMGSSKVSLPGRFAVVSDPAQDGAPVAFLEGDAPKEGKGGDASLLKTIYDCGPVAGLVWDDFDTIRKRVRHQWSTYPRKAKAVSDSLLAHQKAVHDAQERRVVEGSAFGVQTALGTAAAADTSAVRTLNDRRLFEPTPLDDELDDALQTYVSNETRPRRDVPTAPEYMGRVYGYERLNQLVTGGQWRGLALAAESTILETPADQELKLMKCWTYRTLALLQQQGCGALAVAELDRLECATGYANVARRAVVELGRSPTVVWPFELRLLRAQAPGVAAGDWAESIARLSALQRGCSRVLSRPGGDGDASGEERIVLNRRRVFRLSLMIAACAANLGDSSVAVQTLDQLLPADSNDDESDVRLLSAAARLYLQLGGIAAAERLFLRVENIAPKDDKLVLMNQAFYAVATAKWDVARDLFAR
ncbi:hypothetical protein GGI11_003105, partial [Coemansia sp. RSA 2049]